jgi:hypothetical protein
MAGMWLSLTIFIPVMCSTLETGAKIFKLAIYMNKVHT